MADEKKPDAKKDDKKPASAPAPSGNDPLVEIATVVFGIMILMYLVNGVTSAVNSTRLFSHGFAGLTPRGILLAHTMPLLTLPNPIGAKIVSLNTTAVYNSPAGKKIGEQEMNARGLVLQGPVTEEETVYWYVDFEKWEDGWVKDGNIAYLEVEPNWLAKLLMNIFGIVWYVKLFLFILSVIFVICIVYLFRKIMAIAMEETKKLYPPSYFDLTQPDLGVKTVDVNPSWQKILNLIESLNESDWRLAIIEADIILAAILEDLSLPGDTIGDKLKAVERSDFTTIDNAWEAHKVRNQIAHGGSSFMLNQRETKRVIGLYQSVFEEFQVI